MTDPRKPAFEGVIAAFRAANLPNPFNDPGNRHAFHNLLDAWGAPREGQATSLQKTQIAPSPTAPEPKWLIEARRLIGQGEIPGPRHNGLIANGWARLDKKLGLAARFNDDETPWCGWFVAHCIDVAGLPFPRMYARALAWADWGKPCKPTVGAVGVFKRPGGGHVGFLVAENAANYYVLGGNQSNAVNIMQLAKNRLVATRWPQGLGLPEPGLPRNTGGPVSRNEA